MRIMIGGVRALKKGQRPAKPDAFVGALDAMLAESDLEPAFLAQMLAIPSESDVARVIARDIDPALIHRSRRWLRKAIGTQLGSRLVEIYGSVTPTRKFSPDSRSAGERALRIAALALLATRGQAADIDRAARHCRDARNATDEIGALGILSTINGPERTEAFDRFYARWKNDHLVINSWFGLQAAAPLSSALRTVKQLTTHPKFSMRTPNNVYALIGSFANSNPVQFNRPDGKGYDFVAARILELDKFNPQVASRMLNAFRSWRTLENGRRRMGLRALQQIASTPDLSNDVHEIVNKMLE
jgi:aminopeptidase N